MILEDLNENQRQAILATEGRVRVVAGAGSGKTRVLAHRFAYLVNEVGINPGNVLCITFTNKAANEMRKRIAKLVDAGDINDFVCTIHGFCVKVLRREIHRLGYPRNFVIMDEEDSKTLAKSVLESFHIDYTKSTLVKFLRDLTIFKCQKDYITQIIKPDANGVKPRDITEFERYIQLQLQNFCLDFNDIIYYTLYIFSHYPDALSYWADQVNYLMVDEVQDCNSSDWAIINHISSKYGNLFIVGDPDQAIYEWRGASPQTFVNFKADTDVVLDLNYRSTPNILDLSNSIISHNKMRVAKSMRALLPEGSIPIHYHGKNENDEATWIAKQIQLLNEQGTKNNDIAILYRASYLSRTIEQALMRLQIKYDVWGGVRFFERREIKDVLAYLRLVACDDNLSFQRIVNVPSRKFGDKSMQKIRDYATEEKTSLFQTLVNHIDDEIFARQSLQDFVELIEECRGFKDFSSLTEVTDYILKQSQLLDVYRTEGDEERLDNINELLGAIKVYEESQLEEEVSLENYLQDIALYTNQDYRKEGDTVKLMTIHQAKGLEFPYVFVCGMSEGIFPSLRAIRDRSKNGEEEERRLMYVATTRSERGLFLTESEGYNFSLKSQKCPSRFLQEIGDGLITVDGEFDPQLFKETEQFIHRNYDRPIDKLCFNVGDIVTHKIFGQGKILEKRGASLSAFYAVDFAGSIKLLQPFSLQRANDEIVK